MNPIIVLTCSIVVSICSIIVSLFTAYTVKPKIYMDYKFFTKDPFFTDNKFW